MAHPEKTSSVICTLVFLVFALCSFKCYPKEEIGIENIFDNYKGMKTYCDSGISVRRDGKREKFERCFRYDGYYRISIFNRHFWGNIDVRWSDNETNYKYVGNTKDGTLKTKEFGEWINRKKQKIDEYINPDLILDIFNSQLLVGPATQSKVIRKKYIMNTDLSNGDISVLDYQTSHSDSKKKEIIRLWVSNSDFIITKVATFVESEQVSFTELSDIRVNSKLTSDDLSYEPPIRAKYTLNKRPEIVVPGLMLVAFIFGFLFWLVKFLRSIDTATNTIPWSFKLKMWKSYSVFVLVVVGVILILGAITSNMTGGHPRPVSYVYGFGILFALGALVFGTFLSSAHFAYWVAKTLVKKRCPS